MRTVAILDQSRVRILDKQGDMLVDSGPPVGLSQLAWLIPPGQEGSGFSDYGLVVAAIEPGQIRKIQREFPNLTIARLEEHGRNSRIVLAADQPANLTGQPVISNDPERTVVAQPLADDDDDEFDLRTLLALINQGDSPRVREPIGDSNRPLGYGEFSQGPNFGENALAA